MMRCKEMLSVLALLVPVALGAGLTSMTSSSAVASERYAELCAAAGVKASEDGRGACVHTGPEAPELNQLVCWNGKTARVKGAGSCIGTERTYELRYGEVIDPMTGLVAAYQPLESACQLVSCAPSDLQSQLLEDDVACCDPDTGDCTLADDGFCPEGDITWCKELDDNGDGTVTCHE